MELLKDKIKRKENELKSLKDSYKKLFDLLKKDSLEYNAEYLGHVSRRILSLVINEYIKDTSWKPKYSFHKGSVWNDQGKFVGENNKIFFIYENFWDSHYTRSNSINVGFICKPEDIYDGILKNEKVDIWLWYCEDQRYRKSYDDFYNECKSKKIDFIKIYYDFLTSWKRKNQKKEFILQIINEPSLKIKNTLIYFEK